MIDIKTLTQEDIGRKVVYEKQYTLDEVIFSSYYEKQYMLEEGIISSYNDKYIFVKYGTCATAQVTSPEDLTFSFE